MNIGTGSSERQIYVGGEYVPENEARISVFDHAVLYGDAVYDTACAWGARCSNWTNMWIGCSNLLTP